MKRKVIAVIVLLMFLMAPCYGVYGTEENEIIPAMTEAEDWYDVSTDSYHYPITPESPEWATFDTHDEMVEACTIPQEILDDISTKDLAELVLEYPLSIDCMAFSNEELGIEIVEGNFNGLKELLRRDDGLQTLLSCYKKITLKAEDVIPETVKKAAKASSEDLLAKLDEFEKSNPAAHAKMESAFCEEKKKQFAERILSNYFSDLPDDAKTVYEKAYKELNNTEFYW